MKLTERMKLLVLELQQRKTNMGFKINVNNILRQDFSEPLQVGQKYSFEKEEMCIIADDIQIWLTKKDWTALGEIQITSQTRTEGKTVGTFVIKYLYSEVESQAMTNIFTRMYGWK